MKIHNDDVDIVNKIIAAKTAQCAWMPHPDLPDEEALRLYEVFDYKTKTGENTHTAIKEATLATSLSGPSSSALASLLPSAPASASSSAVSDKQASMEQELAQAKRVAAPLEEKENKKKQEAEGKKLKREEEKEKPLNKAKSQSLSLGKEIATMESVISNLKKLKIPDQVRSQWSKTLGAELKALKKLKVDLDKCSEDDKALLLVEAAPVAIQGSSDQRKSWKKVKKALTEL